ncbi:MAG: Survival protein SurE, partial [Actinomycetota bacterium]
LVTNDDGIDSVGLHVLARAMREHAGDSPVLVCRQRHPGIENLQTPQPGTLGK